MQLPKPAEQYSFDNLDQSTIEFINALYGGLFGKQLKQELRNLLSKASEVHSNQCDAWSECRNIARKLAGGDW